MDPLLTGALRGLRMGMVGQSLHRGRKPGSANQIRKFNWNPDTVRKVKRDTLRPGDGGTLRPRLPRRSTRSTGLNVLRVAAILGPGPAFLPDRPKSWDTASGAPL